MKKNKYKESVKKANCALELERKIVGVRFLFSKEEFDQSGIKEQSGRIPYCKMVAKATQGRGTKANCDNFGCFAGARVLGIVEIDDWYSSGHYYGKCGLYQDYPTAKEVTNNIAKVEHKAYGVEVRPLEDFDIEPHVVIVISNTFNIMRFIQGYTYKYGTYSDYKFIGSQAICAECTAHPYKKNSINVSLLCAGARKRGLNKDEIAMGVTLKKFIGIVEGLCETITPVELNANKKIIEKKMKKSDISDFDIVYNKNYGTEMHKHDFAYFLDKSQN